MVCDRIGRIDVWERESMGKVMREERDRIDVVFGVFGMWRGIVELVVDGEWG